jgi:hypothetical protein
MLADLLDSDAMILDALKLKKEAQRERARARQIRGAVRSGDGRVTWNVREAAGSSVYLTGK